MEIVDREDLIVEELRAINKTLQAIASSLEQKNKVLTVDFSKCNSDDLVKKYHEIRESGLDGILY